jgi:hypothetical protein
MASIECSFGLDAGPNDGNYSWAASERVYFSQQRSTALKAALDLDLFSVIDDGANTAAGAATRCGASERGIRILCDYPGGARHRRRPPHRVGRSALNPSLGYNVRLCGGPSGSGN